MSITPNKVYTVAPGRAIMAPLGDQYRDSDRSGQIASTARRVYRAGEHYPFTSKEMITRLVNKGYLLESDQRPDQAPPPDMGSAAQTVPGGELTVGVDGQGGITSRDSRDKGFGDFKLEPGGETPAQIAAREQAEADAAQAAADAAQEVADKEQAEADAAKDAVTITPRWDFTPEELADKTDEQLVALIVDRASEEELPDNLGEFSTEELVKFLSQDISAE